MRRAGHQPEGRSRNVAGDPFVHRLHPNPSFEAPRDLARSFSRLASDTHASRPEHPLGMVARPDSLPDRRPAVGSQAGQKNRRFHLGARDRSGHVDRAERPVTNDGQWRKSVVPSGVEHGAHRAQWADDTGHGTATQRRVAVEDGVHRQARQDAAGEPHAGAGVAAIEDVDRFREAVDARRHHPVVDRPAVVPRSLHGCPEGAHDARRRAHVLAVSGAADVALAGGQSGHEERPMAD